MHRYLYLLRHAESKEKQVGQDDHERKLTPRGMREALLIGTYLFKEKTVIDVIISSTAERAKATAGLVVDGLKWDHKTITFSDELYEASTRTFFHFLAALDDSHKHVMCISHNPVITYVAEYLTKEEIGDMAPGSFVAIKFNIDSWNEVGEGNGELENYIYPEMLTTN
jgi:phosphohistidine phosphatase